MKILFDCQMETMYPLAKEGFSGGSQTYVKAIIKGLVAKGHQVHVIAPDLEIDEQRGPNEWWWNPKNHPTVFDVAIQQMHINPNADYEAPALVLMTSCVDPYLGPNHEWGKQIDAYPVFSQVHKDLLLKMRPTVPEDRIHITGLGVSPEDYAKSHKNGTPMRYRSRQERLKGQDKHYIYPDKPMVPGRMLYANDPARGLFYAMDVFDIVHDTIPEATLHVAYDFDTQLSWRMWEHSHMAQMLLDCKRRMETTPGIVNLGGISRQEIIREQLECQVHCYPADPPGIGTQTHGLTQMECAAAGAALVLSDIEAFPEVFGEGAIILPTIGKFFPNEGFRWKAEYYAEHVIDMMKSPGMWQEYSRKARALAEKHTWQRVVDNWEKMLESLVGVQVG